MVLLGFEGRKVKFDVITYMHFIHTPYEIIIFVANVFTNSCLSFNFVTFDVYYSNVFMWSTLLISFL